MKQFAKTSWTVGDVQSLFDITDEQAETFLLNNQSRLQGQLVQHGWQVLESLGEAEGLPDVN
jgi:hypothetical protein|tara:strand:- start:4007 stop:4192 length:186 start_codon:yes stop_codon:yes gene_type:complete